MSNQAKYVETLQVVERVRQGQPLCEALHEVLGVDYSFGGRVRPPTSEVADEAMDLLKEDPDVV